MTEPTDAELWQLHMQMPGVHKNPIDFARAVLAKWGTPPVVSGEPDYATFALWYADHIGDENKPVRDAALATYEAFAPQQPTQAQAGAVPLTDEDLNAKARCEMPKWWNTYGASLCGCAPYLATPPQVYAMRGFLGGFSAGYKLALDTHGIKGGQHGAE